MKNKDTQENTENLKGSLKGVVVSDKMDKTVVVSVARLIKHPKYGKFYQVNKKFKVHDENNKYTQRNAVRYSRGRRSWTPIRR